MKLLATIIIALVATGAATAEELPTPVDARLDTIARPRVIHAGGFVYAPSPVTGSALFAAEYLTPDSLEGPARRSDRFAVDMNLPADQRVFSSDYEGLGRDRGHLAGSRNHKRSQAEQDATFVMTNVVPQAPKLNRGLWSQIEATAADLVRGDQSAYVVTLPIYGYRTQPPLAVGPRNVLVPTHLAKALLLIRAGEPAGCRAWIVPNADSAEGQPDKFATSVDDVEAASQIDLFGWLPDAIETRMESQR